MKKYLEIKVNPFEWSHKDKSFQITKSGLIVNIQSRIFIRFIAGKVRAQIDAGVDDRLDSKNNVIYFCMTE